MFFKLVDPLIPVQRGNVFERVEPNISEYVAPRRRVKFRIDGGAADVVLRKQEFAEVAHLLHLVAIAVAGIGQRYDLPGNLDIEFLAVIRSIADLHRLLFGYRMEL